MREHSDLLIKLLHSITNWWPSPWKQLIQWRICSFHRGYLPKAIQNTAMILEFHIFGSMCLLCEYVGNTFNYHQHSYNVTKWHHILQALKGKTSKVERPACTKRHENLYVLRLLVLKFKGSLCVYASHRIHVLEGYKHRSFSLCPFLSTEFSPCALALNVYYIRCIHISSLWLPISTRIDHK